MGTHYLENTWYQAGWANEVPRGGMLARTIAEQPLLLLRDAQGEIGAVLDRCPHRFAPLSRGRFDGSRITCGYHGLGFDRTGQCVHNPHGPVPARARVAAFPAAEKHHALWVWFGAVDKADPGLIPNLSIIDSSPPHACGFSLIEMEANWQLIIDNLLDLSHSDFLHPAFAGFITNAKMTVQEQAQGISVRWAVDDHEPIPIHKMLVPTGNADMWVEANWQPPGVIVIDAGATPAGASQRHNCRHLSLHNIVPETASTSHYFYFFTRDFNTDDTGMTAIIKQTTEQAFWNEDRPMILAQQSRVGAQDIMTMNPMLLSVDAAAVRARRKLQALMPRGG